MSTKKTLKDETLQGLICYTFIIHPPQRLPPSSLPGISSPSPTSPKSCDSLDGFVTLLRLSVIIFKLKERKLGLSKYYLLLSLKITLI